jgi:phenylacetate-CoA ligase
MALNLNSTLGLPPPYLKAFLIHAARNSPYYREQDWAKNLLAGLPVRLTDIPETTKADVAAQPEAFLAENIPPETSIIKSHTSGTTGLALEISKSQQHYDINRSENIRLLNDWNIASYRLAVVNMIPKKGKEPGTVEVIPWPNGRTVHRLYSNSVEQLTDFVLKLRPSHVHARPSLLEPMLQSGHDFTFLKLVETSLEPTPQSLKDLVAKLPGCRNLDTYGSVEAAMISMGCPHCGFHHVARATNTVEVVKDDGRNAGESETGRLLVTVHSNPVMPLIRYDTGDHVRVTFASPCEPGQLSIREIMGRERNLFIAPNGERIWPYVNPVTTTAMGIRQLKLVQTSADTIEVRYDTLAGVEHVPLDDLQKLIDWELAPGFQIVPIKTSNFPLAASGKYLKHERLF